MQASPIVGSRYAVGLGAFKPILPHRRTQRLVVKAVQRKVRTWANG